MSEENECQINNLIRNPGFHHIPTYIFQCLNLESLATCRNVSKEWRDFIDLLTSFWRIHLRKTRELMKVKQRYHFEFGDLQFDREKFLIDARKEEFLSLRNYDMTKRIMRYYWTFWTHAFDHYEFEVNDNIIVKEFVLLMYDYWEEIRRDAPYDYSKYKLCDYWKTPLHHAAKRGTNLYLFNYVIQNGYEFQILHWNKAKWILFHACDNFKIELIELLLKHQDQLKIDLSNLWNLSYFDEHGNTQRFP